MKKIITDLNLTDKKVLMRVDFNVPMKDGKITDENRIIQALPTIKYALEHNAKLILFSHLGKVKTEEDKASKSLKTVAEKLSELLGKEVTFISETRGEKLESAINNLKSAEQLAKKVQAVFWQWKSSLHIIFNRWRGIRPSIHHWARRHRFSFCRCAGRFHN